ncbi:hypothetical protein PM082_022657 [Marasmius tenuissimus]|nr:hypothetical protein PM082_022657 [Marasmius tenuissimus]
MTGRGLELYKYTCCQSGSSELLPTTKNQSTCGDDGGDRNGSFPSGDIDRGFLVCNYLFTLYATLMPDNLGAYGDPRGPNPRGHVTVMLKVSTVMLLTATLHFSVAFYRAWIAFRGTSNEVPGTFLAQFNLWHRVLQDMLFVTQESLGAAAAIYRAWVLWGKDWRLLCALLVMYTAELATGSGSCILYAGTPASGYDQAVLFENLGKWIKAHASIIVCLNFITTSLMVFRIWSTKHNSSKYSLFPSRLDAVLRIVLESAMLQLIPEILLLIFQCFELNVTYVLLQLLVPLIAVTFNTMTLRMKIHVLKDSLCPHPSYSTSRLGANSSGTERSFPMQPIRIPVDIHSRRSHHDLNLEAPVASNLDHDHGDIDPIGISTSKT